MNPKILVIDDEQSIRVTLEHFLIEEGNDVVTAEDYDSGLVMAEDNSFDLIITDIILGGKTGIDLLREVKRRKMNCPVIMITGAPDIKTATDALRLGAFDYISKPVKKNALLHVTGMALRHKKLHDEKEKYRLNLEAIFSNINEGIVTVDKNGVIIGINESARRICEFPPDSAGKAFESLPEICIGKCKEMLNETIAKKEPIEIHRHECHLKNRRGNLVVTLNASPLFDNNGEFSGAMLVIRDDTRIENLASDLHGRKQFHNIIGKSEKMQKIYFLIEDLADVSTTVLINGESGTGKELVAEALHCMGNRKDKPIIRVNCAALQESLLESELFGHVKGAFTGAIEDKAGRFQKADGGTIFLDEIGDISGGVQLKLLRVIQEREFERVGDSTPVKVDVRVVTATNKDLRKKVTSGEFREDLYYRLKVVEINMPPLRENREDIPLLAKHFLEKFNRKLNKKIDSVSDEVMKVILDHTWPGNIRELEHTIEHAFVVCRQNIITVDDLPADLNETFSDGADSPGDNKNKESKAILLALEKTGWNISRAARLMGMSRPTIYRKIKENNLDKDRMDRKL